MKIERELAREIVKRLINRGNFQSEVVSINHLNSIHEQKILDFINNDKKIQLILPAYPAKSGNSEKTHSPLPDLGEVESLRRLQALTEEISAIYEIGAEVIICSDGRVFSDLVGVKENDVTTYKFQIQEIVSRFELTSIKLFDLEDVYSSSLSFHQMREILENDFAIPIETIRLKTKSETAMARMFNGIHRFIKEDYLVIHSDLSKSQIQKISKDVAYKVIQRSNAWSKLVERKFPEAVRLSIHPQTLDSYKFPIQLLPCEEHWGTPWHRVPILKEGKLELMKKLDAIKLGAIQKSYMDQYVYFELGTPA